jgi:hypothetical protein
MLPTSVRTPGSKLVFLTGNSVFQIICRLSRVEPQRDYNVPVIYGVLYDSGDLYKDAVFGSVCSCRTVCTRLVCVNGVCVYVYEQILQLYPDEGCQKNNYNNIVYTIVKQNHKQLYNQACSDWF